MLLNNGFINNKFNYKKENQDMKKVRHKILSVIMSIALLTTIALTNQGLFGLNLSVSAEEPTPEEYFCPGLAFNQVTISNNNIRYYGNVSWTSKSANSPDDTVPYGETFSVEVGASNGYIIEGTPSIIINDNFTVTGTYLSSYVNHDGNSISAVTFTMPDIGDNNAEINKIVISGLTASPKSYDVFFDNEAMKIYSNVAEPINGVVDLTGLTANTGGDFEMKGDAGYYAEIIPPAPNATYNVESNLFSFEDSDESWYYYDDQQTIILINDARGKTTGIYFKVTPQYIDDNKDMLKLRITLTDVVIPSSEKAITNFAIGTSNGAINETNHTIAVTVPFGTNVTSLTPTIATNEKATVNPDSGVAQNFSNPVKYTVTAEDTTTQDYTVTVTVASKPPVSTPAEQIKDIIDTTNPAPLEIAKTSNSEFKNIKADAVLSKATDAQKEALKNMTTEQIQAEIKKATDAISTVNTTKISAKAKEKLEEIKKTLPTDAKIMPINFTEHATFAFPVQVTIPVDKATYPAGTYHLYYYNEETDKLEDCGTVTVDANGMATFTISHCSDYFISSKVVDLSATAPAPANTNNPKTGESNPVGTISTIAILSIATLGVVSKKRKFKVVK